MDDGRPLFLQIAGNVENDIVTGELPEEGQVPSTNEYAAFHRINPATVAKGVGRLVDEGILYKRRGIGMFVAPGARQRLLVRRRASFREQYLIPLLAEAAKLGLSADEVSRMIAQEVHA